VHYWGDLDSHGFAILDQLRAHLPHAQALLMDAATLHAHRAQWVPEPAPALRQLTRLRGREAALCQSLITGQTRLEQERLAFGWVQRALAAL
jgi:hypothetical protein